MNAVTHYALHQLRNILISIGCEVTERQRVEEFFSNNIGCFLGDIQPDGKPEWIVDPHVTDDHSPFDWSVVITKGKIVPRIVYEVQCKNPTIETMRVVALNHFQFIKGKFGVNTEFGVESQVEAILQRPNVRAWFATDFSTNPLFKIYLGAMESQSDYHHILDKFGVLEAFKSIESQFSQFEKSIEAVSVDLGQQQGGRIKLYVRFSTISMESLTNVLESCSIFYDKTNEDFLNRFFEGATKKCLSDDHQTKALVTFVLHPSEKKKALVTKLQLPVRFYFKNDLELLQHVMKFLRLELGDQRALMYENIILNLQNHRSLESSTGIQSIIAYSNPNNIPEFTLYFSPEMYHPNHSSDRLNAK